MDFVLINKMIEQIKNKIIEKLYDEFRVILYKELDITMDQFLSFFHEDPLENILLSAYDVGGAKGFKSEFYDALRYCSIRIWRVLGQSGLLSQRYFSRSCFRSSHVERVWDGR